MGRCHRVTDALKMLFLHLPRIFQFHDAGVLFWELEQDKASTGSDMRVVERVAIIRICK